MRLKVITLPWSRALDGFDTSRLEEFVRDKEIHEVRDYLVDSDGRKALTLLLFYAPEEVPAQRFDSERDAWRKLLTDRDMPLFGTLKEWRNALARSRGISEVC